MMAEQTALIGVDWGTSALRAYRIGKAGTILERHAAPAGIMTVVDGDFAGMLQRQIGAWLEPGLPVLLSGMIGSRQGWLEAPYCPVPTTPAEIAQRLVRHPAEADLHFVPGLAYDPGPAATDEAPDVLRGEETQIMGALALAAPAGWLVLPGTHSKWVQIAEGRICRFQTYMTGELYAVLRQHSILGRLMTGEDHEPAAFAAGLSYARSGRGGLSAQLFSVRTLGLFERLPSHGLASYLSGLLIGREVLEATAQLTPAERAAGVLLLGATSLAERYAEALSALGLSARIGPEDCGAHGQVLIARAAGLLA